MSFLSTRVHLIWATAKREPFIRADWQPRLHGYMRGILENMQSKVLAIGGVSDHVHAYCSLPATLAIADLVSAVKSNSSRWAHEVVEPRFHWQDGYAAFTMSKSADADVVRYIMNQEVHHRGKTFQEELIEFLERFEVSYDAAFIFA